MIRFMFLLFSMLECIFPKYSEPTPIPIPDPIPMPMPASKPSLELKSTE